MTSREEAYVWIWLPAATTPVVAGLLTRDENQLLFNYGQSYLRRPDAIPLYLPELPLQSGNQFPRHGLNMPGCIRDASPDAWGRRVLINRLHDLKGAQAAAVELDELTYLLESGSDRIGALDFQASPTTYAPRLPAPVSLDDLAQSAEMVEKGLPLSPELDLALRHGTSLGGARPKASVEEDDRKFIAKFSASNDLYNVVKAEFVAMRLAAAVGLDVAPVALNRALGKDVLLVERFDREQTHRGWCRKAIVSALTLLELDEMMARYASYEDLAEIIRYRFVAPEETLKELFGRMAFNILCGNTDDHARNHAAFWDGQNLSLTPAYDICPQGRAGNEASQAMKIHEEDRMSRLASCLAAAPAFLLDEERAKSIIRHQIHMIRENWSPVCDAAGLPAVERSLLWQRQFLNPFAFENAPADLLG